MDTQVKLEHEVSFRWLIVFALPTILSSIFSSLYSTVDGIFIARLVDTDALSAINITMPMIFLASAIGMMFGSGGNALVAKKLGEGKQREAQEDYSLGTGRRSYCNRNRICISVHCRIIKGQLQSKTDFAHCKTKVENADYCEQLY